MRAEEESQEIFLGGEKRKKGAEAPFF